MKVPHATLLIFALILISNFGVSQQLDLNLGFSNASPLLAKINGFNTEQTFNEIFQADSIPSNFVNTCNLFPQNYNAYKVVSLVPKKDMVDKTALLQPSTLRFPGGTASNYYHLYQYTGGTYNPDQPTFAPGFGMQDIETQEFQGGDVIRKQFCEFDNHIQTNDPNPNYINGFANYVDSVEHAVHASGDTSYKIDVIYVANVRSHFKTILIGPDKGENLAPSDPNNPLNVLYDTTKFELYYKEVIDAISYLKDREINVVGVEMGNELYFPRYTSTRSDIDPPRYLALCKIYADRIKAVYPELEFAVPTDEVIPNWHAGLLADTTGFFDAVVIHPYYKDSRCITPNAYCPGSCSGDIINDRVCRFDCGKCAMHDFIEDELPQTMTSVLNGFPVGTDIWMTEWSLVNQVNSPDDNLNYMNTFLYMGFTMEQLAEQLKFNATSGNRLRYSTHHRLGYSNQWSAIQAFLTEDSAVLRSSFYSFQLLNDIFYGDLVYHWAGANLQNLASPSDAYAETFLVLDSYNLSGSIQVVFNNKTPDPLPLNPQYANPVNFNGNAFLAQTNASASYVYADVLDSTGLFASAGETRFNGTLFDNSNQPNLLAQYDSTFSMGQFVIPPYAAGVIEIGLTNSTSAREDSFLPGSVFFLYPNPSQDWVNIDLPLHFKPQKVTLIDSKGTFLQIPPQFSQGTLNLKVSELANGVYGVLMQDNHQSGFIRFVKQ